jgi:NADH dehydrogenase FAD-containing subunit
MAFIGNRSAIAQLPPFQRPAMNYMWRTLHGEEQPQAQEQQLQQQHVKGTPAFLFWRSVYFSKLLSGSNRAAIAKDWLRTEVMGRDVVLTHSPIMPRSYESG